MSFSLGMLRGTAACSAFVLIWGLAISPSALPQTSQEGKNLGALAKENLDKKRPKPGADLTGTYNFDLEGKPGTAFQFLPVPPLTPAAQAVSAKLASYQAKGLAWRDDSAACWPLGLPMVMTRYWPIQIVQLPTEVLLISMFDNNIRWIYTDGRGHPPDDEIVETYNGHSIGHWEGKTLVVDTIGMTDDHHWVQPGVPASNQLHVIERYTLSADRNTLDVEFKMTDPVNWVGDWVSKKKWTRDDHADIEEHICIYEQMQKLPGFKENVRE